MSPTGEGDVSPTGEGDVSPTGGGESTSAERTTRGPGGGFVARLSAYVANGLRYWEPRRLVYNLALACVVLARFVEAWPGSRAKISVDVVLSLFILAVLANVAYCAVYVVDIFVQFSGLDAAWRRGRVAVLLVGTAFAAALTYFFTQTSF